MLRRASVSTLPVVMEDAVEGIVSEADLMSFLATHRGQRVEDLRNTPVSQVMSHQVLTVNEDLAVEQIADVFREQGYKVLPVVDSLGEYRGMLSRSDVLAVVMGTISPATLGGMATPLGVYLTTGNLRAGPGDLGLFLTGAALMLINYLSLGIMYLVAWLVQNYTSLPWFTIALGSDFGPNMVYFGKLSWWAGAFSALQLALFLFLFRSLPLTGYHAAEHQVVHAIEEGQELTLEKVRTMPRVHPWCGTNLFALLIIVVILVPALTSTWQAISRPGSGGGESGMTAAGLVALLIFLALTWRWIGRVLQQYVTTRPASEKQLLNAIAAGEQLLSAYRQEPGGRRTVARRIWSMGLIQVIAGFGSIGWLFHQASKFALDLICR